MSKSQINFFLIDQNFDLPIKQRILLNKINHFLNAFVHSHIHNDIFYVMTVGLSLPVNGLKVFVHSHIHNDIFYVMTVGLSLPVKDWS